MTVKFLTKSAPTKAELRRMERVLEVLRNRFDRYLARQYTRLLNRMRNEMLQFDTVPPLADLEILVQSYDGDQMHLLTWVYQQMAPELIDMVSPDQGKSIRRGERKAIEDSLDAYIAQILGEHIQRIDRTTLERIRRIYRESMDVDEFRKALQDQVFQDNRYRAVLIARTETTSSSNLGLYKAAEEYSFGRRVMKTWHTMGTMSVRETHQVMDGVTIPLEDYFEVPNTFGGFDIMKYPGDMTSMASPGNVINCRCYITTSYED